MFRKKKKNTVEPEPNNAINSLAKGIIKCQILFANTLNRKSGKWSPGQQKIFLSLFVIGMAAITMAQLLVLKPNVFNVSQHNSPPPTLLIPREEQGKTQLSPRDSLAVERFVQRLQQLQASPEGRDSLQAFEQKRPGFIDSVLHMKKMLHH